MSKPLLTRGLGKGYANEEAITVTWIVVIGVKGYRGMLQTQVVFDNQKEAEDYAKYWRKKSSHNFAEVL